MRTPTLPDPTAPRWPIRLALVGAMLGLFASAYLLVDYVFGSGICLTGSGCDLVRASDFAYPLGVPTPLLGLGYYAVAVVLLLAAPNRRVVSVPARTVRIGWATAGASVMAGLTLVEIFVIHAFCSWCLLSALGSALLVIGVLAARPAQGVPSEEPGSARARRNRLASIERSRNELRRFAAMTGAVLGVALGAMLSLSALNASAASSGDDIVGADRPQLGSGAVEVVVFSDFQCPACRVAAPMLEELARDGSATLVYRYFPLISIHANAASAAEAAQAAALQGRFWDFHDALFARQAEWASLTAQTAASTFESIAGGIGLDVARWRSDAISHAVIDAVAADRREAERLQLSGTPTIFIGGVRYDGRLDQNALRAAVLAATPAAPAP
jgi:protein-disulfide isomerase